jgi:hypothetical protein
MSSSSLASIGESSGGSGKGPSGGIGVGRKASFGLQEALGRQ